MERKSTRRRIRGWRTAAVLATGVAIGTTMMATPAIGHVGGTVGHLWNHLKPKADARYVRDSEVLWAVVNADGTTARANGAVSSGRFTAGQYRVVFNRNVTGCTYSATIGNPGDGFSSGIVGVALLSGTTNGVFIGTQDAAGTFADRSFHLEVSCDGAVSVSATARSTAGAKGVNR
ncbi:MAG: hypothetical protein KY396_05440 [Actinobacteria bacterium]|nr:hypothetical protein [Actinomycetota bacterium]